MVKKVTYFRYEGGVELGDMRTPTDVAKIYAGLHKIGTPIKHLKKGITKPKPVGRNLKTEATYLIQEQPYCAVHLILCGVDKFELTTILEQPKAVEKDLPEALRILAEENLLRRVDN